jgi:hypothetical protein
MSRREMQRKVHDLLIDVETLSRRQTAFEAAYNELLAAYNQLADHYMDEAGIAPAKGWSGGLSGIYEVRMSPRRFAMTTPAPEIVYVGEEE